MRCRTSQSSQAGVELLRLERRRDAAVGRHRAVAVRADDRDDDARRAGRRPARRARRRARELARDELAGGVVAALRDAAGRRRRATAAQAATFAAWPPAPVRGLEARTSSPRASGSSSRTITSSITSPSVAIRKAQSSHGLGDDERGARDLPDRRPRRRVCCDRRCAPPAASSGAVARSGWSARRASRRSKVRRASRSFSKNERPGSTVEPVEPFVCGRTSVRMLS